ncbi:hypothetical protein PHMEG_00030219 [Phytophthora megakarya]|uniref:Uncharacterized protein n=1 Tax=Phytophthora megakarya TaxID=4795 RepID=A0A225V3A4_9STRA|nr:hypothetical protein PHMEG_00030219 [Phytophthora megakarya]
MDFIVSAGVRLCVRGGVVKLPDKESLLLSSVFGPDEDYQLVIQENVDVPDTVKQGEVNQQWQTLADKINRSPNCHMKLIKGTTARPGPPWQHITESARMSSVDEPETVFIHAMTEQASDFESKLTHDAAAKDGEQRANAQAGEVVREAAVSRINLGKRHSRSDNTETEANEGETQQCTWNRAKVQATG